MKWLAIFALLGSVAASGFTGYWWGQHVPDAQAQLSRETSDAQLGRDEVRSDAPVALPAQATASLAPPTAGSNQDAPHEAKPPEQVRDEQRAALVASGPENRGLLAAATKTGAAWQTIAANNGVNGQLGGWSCYAAGCTANGTYDSAQDLERYTRLASESPEFNNWPGPKLRTGPIPTSDDKVEVAWVLFAPEE